MLYITTSWDDGDVLDVRLGELLSQYGMRGTFYITKEYREHRLSEDHIRDLAKRHEVGAHTLTHPDLRRLSREQKKQEIAGSKEWLENVIETEVAMFCYPSGFYDVQSGEVAREVGFCGARTTEAGRTTLGTDLFAIPTTLQVYPMPFRKIDSHTYWWGKIFEPLRQRSSLLRALGLRWWDMRSFESAACAAFDIALKKGGVFHLWGHSWEIEKYGMWDEFERVLRHITKHSGVQFVTNGELLKISTH